MDADSIGGSVNLRSKSAFDRPRERRTRFSAAMTYGAENKVADPVYTSAFTGLNVTNDPGAEQPLLAAIRRVLIPK